MPSYCLKCEKNTKNITLQVSRAINRGIIILSKCAVVVIKNQNLLKNKKQDGY